MLRNREHGFVLAIFYKNVKWAEKEMIIQVMCLKHWSVEKLFCMLN